MIEFLQPLVNAVSRALPAFTEKRRQDAVAELGAELFLVYVQLNEALVIAEIVNSLEKHGKPPGHVRSRRWELGSRVRMQLENLQGIRATMRRWSRELQVLDGEAINQLHFLLNYKLNALDVLAAVIDRQRLPLGFGDAVLDDRGVLQPQDYFARYDEINRSLEVNSVPMNQPWESDILAVIDRYLAQQQPRERMAEIRSSLERIRRALESNFSLTDVLMRVGDRRLSGRASDF